LTVTGILGVLERAAQRELVDLSLALTRLLATNFYAPANLVRDLLACDADRKARAVWRNVCGAGQAHSARIKYSKALAIEHLRDQPEGDIVSLTKGRRVT